MSEQLTNLPGYYATLKDGGIMVSAAAATSDIVLLLGTAVDGPFMEPVTVYNIEVAEALFGGSVDADGNYNGSTLLTGIQEAFTAGARELRAMRITGEAALQVLLADTSATPDTDYVKIAGLYRGDLYKNCRVKIETVNGKKVLSVWGKNDGLLYTNYLAPATPVGSAPAATKTYTIDDYTKLSALVDAFNRDAALHNMVMTASTGLSAAPRFATKVLTALADASTLKTADERNGITTDKTALKAALADAYDIVQDYNADIVVPLGVYVDISDGATVDTQFAQQLAEHCANASASNNETIGVMSISPLADVSMSAVKDAVTLITGDAWDNTYTLNMVDIGRYLNVVFAEPILRNSKLGVYSAPAAATYAGLVASLVPHSATTNKTLSNVAGLRFNLSSAQLSALSGKRVVTFKNKFNRGVVVTDGLTCAKSGSDYALLSTMRIVNAAGEVVRIAAEPFIGEALDGPRRSALVTAITSGLDRMKERGAITNYSFNLYASVQDQINGICDVELNLVPAFELRRIRTTIALRPNIAA